MHQREIDVLIAVSGDRIWNWNDYGPAPQSVSEVYQIARRGNTPEGILLMDMISMHGSPGLVKELVGMGAPIDHYTLIEASQNDKEAAKEIKGYLREQLKLDAKMGKSTRFKFIEGALNETKQLGVRARLARAMGTRANGDSRQMLETINSTMRPNYKSAARYARRICRLQEA